MENPDLLEISAADAAARGIHDGDRVRVFNSRGEILLTARVNGATQPGRGGGAAELGQAHRRRLATSTC